MTRVMSVQEQSFIRPDEFWRNVGLRAEQTIVHLGAGAGFYLLPAAHIVGPKGKAIGIDVLPNMLSEIEGKAKRENIDHIVQTVRANLENPNGSTLADKSADWVLVANILHQSDAVKILGEAARIVAANGKVVIVEWDTSASPFGPPAEKRISKNDIYQALTQVGLKVERELRPSPYHYGFILTI